ncbi:MAG TPA: GAF domain-containing protein [Candidatus Methylomirabilis sp.]|nr:GAF domain-containing protein [Candidatus Methylomirabilis sp.]
MRWTIRAKLTALVLAVLLPLVAGAAFKFWRELAQGRADAHANLMASAQVVARHLDEVLSGQIENLQAVASVRSLEPIDAEDLDTLAARVRARHSFVYRFLAADGNGRVTATSVAPGVDGRGRSVDAGTVAEVLAMDAPRVGPLGPSPVGGVLVVPVVVPVLGPGGALGVVAAEIDVRALSAYLDQLQLGQGTSLVVVDGRGIVLARAGASRRTPGQPLSAEPGVTALLGSRGGVSEWRWEDGVSRLAATAPMSLAHWTVIAAMPSDLAYAPAAAQLRGDLLGLGMVTLAALVAAWMISRPMNRSVEALMAGVRGLASAEGPAIAVTTGDELAELAAQFNQAVAERRRAEAATESRQRRIQALADVNLSLSRQLDPERLLQQITGALVQLTGARSVVLWEADRGAGTLGRRAWATDGTIEAVGLPETLMMDQGGTGWVALHRQPLFVEDVARDARIMAVDWALRHDLVAFAGVPVVAGDELLGVLTLNLARGTLPQGDDRGLLSSFAAQAAVAIGNARLFAEADERRRAAELLSDLGRTLSQALDPEVVAQRIVDSLRALLTVQNSGLFRLERESGDLVVLALSGPPAGGFDRNVRFRDGTGVGGLAVRHRAPVATANILTDPRVILAPVVRAQIERAPYRAVLCVPLIVKDGVIGALAVGDREGRRFDDEQIRLAQAFADQAALALDNARLYEETHQRLRHLDSLRDVVEQILVPVSLEERLNLIAQKAAELFAADRATIALRDAPGGELVVRAGYRMTAGEVGRTVREGLGALGVAVARRQGVLVNDYQSWPLRDPFIVGAYRAQPRQAAIASPLVIRDEVIGALSVGMHEPNRTFGPADLDQLDSLAVPAALAIEHSRLYEELSDRLRELQDTQAQLVQAGKLSAVGQLVSGVAHELNNPLSVVIGYGQLLMGRELPPPVRRPLELIVAQGDRMARIVQSLLLFSRQRKPERGAVNVRDALEQTIGLRATQLMLSSIRVETAFDDAVPAAEGDVHQLQQVFLNLLLNAEQAILGSGVGAARVGDRIGISTATRQEGEQTWIVVRIADNGPGIPADILPRIFEPFFTTKKVGEGTGLGLSVSYGIVLQHGGRLTAESQPGHTVFTLELPAMTRPRPSAAEPEPVAALGSGRGRHALVVDDEPSILDLVTTLLRQAGWSVDVAAGGRAALECLRRERYDLVVSDIRMPDGSGDVLYHAATAERDDVAARFLFMTGDTANPAAWEFLQASRAEVLEKPFTAEALLHAVHRVTA